MASIHKHGAGFRAQYTNAQGKSAAGPTLPTYSEAETWARQNAAGGALTISALADLYDRDAPNRSAFALFVRRAAAARGWGDARRIDPKDLALWERGGGYRATHGRALRLVLSWGISAGLVELPERLAKWTPKRPPRTPRAALLTDDQVEGIRDRAAHFGPRAIAAIDYLLTYGARPITACRLLRRDLDMERCELTIERAKHSGGWVHAVTPEDAERWAALTTDPEQPLFPYWNGDVRPWKIKGGYAQEMNNWYRNGIGRKVDGLGALVSIYHLKRRSVTAMWSAGIDVPTMATFTGHAHLGTLMDYGRSNPDVQRAALAKIKRSDVVMANPLPITNEAT